MRAPARCRMRHRGAGPHAAQQAAVHAPPPQVPSSAMRLDQVISGAPTGAGDLEITSLAYDNRAVIPGTLFFCVPGFTRDGHDFAPQAVEKGAAALVVKRQLNLGVPEVL